MLRKIFILFRIARRLAISDAVEIISKIHKPPIIIKTLLNIFSFSLSKKTDSSNGKSEEDKLCESIQGMGTTFIKLGQFLATRPDIIGEEISKKLEKLQDRLPPFKMQEAKNILKESLGVDNFNTILNLSEPVAAASIAQVHKAQINENGTVKDVAIKILRPEIKKVFNEEIDALMLLAYIIQSTVTKTKRLKLVEVVFLLKEITNHEMDLRFEAAAASELYENTKNDSFIKVPKIYWNFTSKQILTLDRVNAIPIKNLETLKKSKIDQKKLSRNLIQIFLKQAVRDGFFHADMHQGNLFVDEEGNIIPIDFGIMGRLDKNNKRYLAEILYGFIQRDYDKVAQVHFLAGLVPQNTSKSDLAQALRSIGEPIFGQAVKDISGGNLLAQLFDITEKFDMQTQTQLLLLQKTMVSVEGVARNLNPDANIWEISRPILEDWIKKEKGPEAKIKKTLEVSKDVLEKIPDLPDVMDKANIALQMLAEGKLNIYTNSGKNIELEELKMKNERNNIIIIILGVVIGAFVVF